MNKKAKKILFITLLSLSALLVLVLICFSLYIILTSAAAIISVLFEDPESTLSLLGYLPYIVLGFFAIIFTKLEESISEIPEVLLSNISPSEIVCSINDNGSEMISINFTDPSSTTLNTKQP